MPTSSFSVAFENIQLFLLHFEELTLLFGAVTSTAIFICRYLRHNDRPSP